MCVYYIYVLLMSKLVIYHKPVRYCRSSASQLQLFEEACLLAANIIQFLNIAF